MGTSKPEAGQLTDEEIIAIGKAASFLRFEAAYKTHATDEARREWRSVADVLTGIECKYHEQTPPANQPDPDEWVVQDRVPVRVGDYCWWVSNDDPLPNCPSEMWLAHQYSFVVSRKNRHGDKSASGKDALHVMCRRRDLPPVEQCAACDAPAETGTVGCKDCNEYATAICSSQPQPAKTRVRLWISGDDGRVYAAYDPCEPDDFEDHEIHHDAEGFYVIQASH